MTIRLNKLLAQRGVGARRKCDALIQSGAVRVNGRVVTEPGTQVEPERDRVRISGRPIAKASPLRYFALHKPVGVISTMHDPEGRRTLRDVMPPGARLFPVGRLDADTSGLLILTSDGALAHHLMHPRYGVEKVYRARVDRVPNPGQLERLRRGVEIEPGFTTAPARVRARMFEDGGGGIEIALHEGRFRQVRRMCEAVGLTVLKLHRVAYGPLRLGLLARGMWRELSEHEVKLLRAASARPHRRPPGLERRAKAKSRLGLREGRPARTEGRRERRGPRSSERTGTGLTERPVARREERRSFDRTGSGRPARSEGRREGRAPRSSGRIAGRGRAAVGRQRLGGGASSRGRRGPGGRAPSRRRAPGRPGRGRSPRKPR